MSETIYKVPGEHRGPKGLTFSFRGIEDGEKMPDGWSASLPEAIKASLKPKAKRKPKAKE